MKKPSTKKAAAPIETAAATDAPDWLLSTHLAKLRAITPKPHEINVPCTGIRSEASLTSEDLGINESKEASE